MKFSLQKSKVSSWKKRKSSSKLGKYWGAKGESSACGHLTHHKVALESLLTIWGGLNPPFPADVLMRMNTVLLYVDKILKSVAARLYQQTSIFLTWCINTSVNLLLISGKGFKGKAQWFICGKQHSLTEEPGDGVTHLSEMASLAHVYCLLSIPTNCVQAPTLWQHHTVTFSLSYTTLSGYLWRKEDKAEREEILKKWTFILSTFPYKTKL